MNNLNEKKIKIIKILLIGDKNTGKTSIIDKIIRNKFNYKESMPTFGVNYNSYYKNLYDETFKLDFWDISGSIEYINLLEIYYLETDVTILCFDSSEKKTLLSLDSFWLNTISKFKNFNYNNMILLGNKSDLKEKIPILNINSFVNKNKNISYLKYSAKNHTNFDNLINLIIEKYCSMKNIKLIKNEKTKNKSSILNKFINLFKKSK